MKIKKYTGRTFQEAFDHVKAELGDNAVIVNSRKIKEGGILDFINRNELYEITVAAEETRSRADKKTEHPRVQGGYPRPKVQPLSVKIPGNNNGDGNGGSVAALQVNKIIEEQTQEIKLLQGELKDIKQVLNQVSDFLKYSRMPALPECFKKNLKILINNEVHEDLAKAIVQTVYAKTDQLHYDDQEAVDRNTLALISRMVKIAPPLESIERQPYVVALVGPTGVGKTTTIAKLAANLKLYNRSKVALISADTYRIAAIEQLQTFANIATIPMSVVYSPEEMRRAIRKYREYDLILIDTVGRSQKNEQHLQELNQFIEMANPDEIHLVLSLTTGLKNLLDIVRRFRILRPNRFLFTKLDEAINAGNILNLLYKYPLPVSYLTTGQVVPNDISTAQRDSLSNLVFKGVLN
ncbi:MAG: flagellar biosynthesis protein FlhF [Calditrichia bacterium]